MNVYFVAKNYIKEDCFEYLIDVLKVDTVFSFIDVDLMSDSLRRQLGRKLARYKRYLPIDGDVRDFIKKCVNNIVEGAAHLHKEDGRFKYKDLDSYAKSHYDTPINNLTDTDDRNVMIICNMHYRDITLHKSVPIFHSVTRVIENERYSYNYMQYFVDASMETALYTYNKIKKSLGTDKYRERICFVRFGRNIEEIFFKTHWTYNRNNENGEKWKADRSFFNYIVSQLHEKFPDKFPLVAYNGNICFTSFYNIEMMEQDDYDDSYVDIYDDTYGLYDD